MEVLALAVKTHQVGSAFLTESKHREPRPVWWFKDWHCPGHPCPARLPC